MTKSVEGTDLGIWMVSPEESITRQVVNRVMPILELDCDRTRNKLILDLHEMINNAMDAAAGIDEDPSCDRVEIGDQSVVKGCGHCGVMHFKWLEKCPVCHHRFTFTRDVREGELS